MKKIILFALLYSTLLFVAFWHQDSLLTWINQTNYSQLPLMFLLAIMFGIIPIIPYSVFAGVMGAKYGVLIGASINWVGSIGAGIFFFVFVRYFFYDKFQQSIQRFEKVQKFDQMIGRNGFVAVLFSRLIPVIPTPVVNLYSGLSPILFSHYIVATAIGQIPEVIMFAYLGNQIFTSLQTTIYGIVVYVSFLLVVFSVYYWWYRASGVKSEG